MCTMMSSNTRMSTQPAAPARRERIGVSVGAPAIQTLLRTIDEAEAAGVAQLWMTQGPTSLDSLTVYAAAFTHSQRIGIGTSHRPSIEGNYGLPMVTPLAHLREYVGVLRAALWTGEVDHQGEFFTARAKLNQTARLPILVAALGEEAY